MIASIIIPTYQRPDHIRTCLEAIAKQDYPLQNTEVVVVDDGGDQATRQYIETHMESFPFKLKYLTQPKKGRSAARNLGIQNAQGEILLFIGDDIIVTPNWLKTHLTFHEQHPEKQHTAVGFITWYPELPISRYMIWLENGGPLLKFKGLKDQETTDIYHFYTGNVSVKKTLIEHEGFNESTSVYGWEDIELGARLQEKCNMQVWYLQNAIAYHNHLYQESGLEQYAKNMGYSASIFQKSIKGIPIIPRLPKRTIFAIISSLSPVLKNTKKEWYWYTKLKKNFLKGMKQYQIEDKNKQNR